MLVLELQVDSRPICISSKTALGRSTTAEPARSGWLSIRCLLYSPGLALSSFYPSSSFQWHFNCPHKAIDSYIKRAPNVFFKVQSSAFRKMRTMLWLDPKWRTAVVPTCVCIALAHGSLFSSTPTNFPTQTYCIRRHCGITRRPKHNVDCAVVWANLDKFRQKLHKIFPYICHLPM